jgi:inhibitor of cysteine peptidase
MKGKLIAIVLMVGLLLIAAVGCANAEGANVTQNTQKNVEVTVDEFIQNNHSAKTIEINKGDTLVLTLGSNPTTGFSWKEQARISDRTVLEQTQHQYLEPSANAGKPVTGAAGKDAWTFKASKAGQSVITMDYSRPWTGGEQDEWTFQLTVTVK